MSTSFVFYDPTGRRWNRFRRAIGISGIVFAILLSVFILSVISNPQLPALGLPVVQHLANFSEVRTITGHELPVKAIPFKFHKPASINYVRNGGSPLLHAKTAVKPREDQPIVFGFYVNWDPGSIVSLRLNLHHLTHLVPEWLTLKNGDGDLNDETDNDVVRIAQDAKLPILVEINNYRNG